MPYCFKSVLNAPRNTANMAVAVIEAAAVKRNATPEMRLVTRLPRRLQIANRPTINSTAVAPNAMMYAINIHFETDLYVFNALWRLLGRISSTALAALVLFNPHTSTGSNENSALGLEQKSTLYSPELVLLPAQ